MDEIKRLKFLIFRMKIDINSSYGKISQTEIGEMIDERNRLKIELRNEQRRVVRENKLTRILK